MAGGAKAERHAGSIHDLLRGMPPGRVRRPGHPAGRADLELAASVASHLQRVSGGADHPVHSQRGGREMASTTTGTNPISDLMYDWLTVLQSKAEGLNAYE